MIDTSRLGSISLDELTAVAALQNRRDRKYIIDNSTAEAVLNAIDPDTRALQIGTDRRFGYRTIYFDTPELTSYFGAAHRRRRRWKIRTRVYEATSGSRETAALEVKQRDGRGNNTKVALPYDPADAALLTAAGQHFVADTLTGGALPDGLTPMLATQYHRTTLFEPTSGSRATIDFGLTCDGGSLGSVRLDQVVLETKSLGPASTIDRMLWQRGIRPSRFSKYCTSLAALRPDLPANKWHRTLTTHFVLGDIRRKQHEAQ